MKKSISILLLSFLIISVFQIGVLAAPEEIEGNVITEITAFKSEDKNVPVSIKIMNKEIILEGTVEGEESKKETVATFYQGETELFDVNSEDYKLFLTQLSESVAKDAKVGFDALSKANITLDHVRLDTWGEFLNKYYGKTVTSFPLGNIVIKFDDYNISIENNEVAKGIVLNDIVPNLIAPIEQLSKNYPANRYALDITSGSLLKDYQCDLSSTRLVSTVYPLDNVSEYMFFNVGSYFGLSLSKDYVSILRGYIEGDKQGYDRPVSGEVPGCVNVLAYITLIKNISNYTLTDKVLSDFMLYQDLAIALDTKQLVDTTDMTTQNKEMFFSDYKLNPDNLILAPISNDVVILQPTYLECFDYCGVARNFSRTIDITPFVSEGTNYFNVIDSSGNVSQVNVDCFKDTSDRLSTSLGNAPFLMYYADYVPYDLLINWYYNQSSNYKWNSETDKDNFIKTIKSELLSQNRKEDYNSYMKMAGQMTDTGRLIKNVIIGIVIVTIIVVVVVIVLKKKKKAEQVVQVPNSGLMFSDEEDFNNAFNDDDDDVNFEIK